MGIKRDKRPTCSSVPNIKFFTDKLPHKLQMAKHLTAQQRFEISFRLQKNERPIDISTIYGYVWDEKHMPQSVIRSAIIRSQVSKSLKIPFAKGLLSNGHEVNHENDHPNDLFGINGESLCTCICAIGGWHYNKRGSSYKSMGIPGRVGIEQRPSVVGKKGRFGDLERLTPLWGKTGGTSSW